MCVQQADNTGLGVVILDMLCGLEWVGEHDLAVRLNLHIKQIRRVMQYLEQEQLVMREHIRIKQQQRKGALMINNRVLFVVPVFPPTATDDAQTNGSGQAGDKDDAPRVKSMLHSYCAIDFPRVHDVVQLKLHRVRKRIRDQVKDTYAPC